MKRIILFASLLITALAFISNFSACNNAEASKIDAVNDLTPVDVHNIEWRKKFIAELLPLTPAERKEKIDKVVPALNGQFIQNLRSAGYTCTDDITITYVFGSSDDAGAMDGKGKKHEKTFFTDELFAVAKGGKCLGDSIMALVACFNGVFYVNWKGDYQTIGVYEPIFTIEKGFGTNRYVEWKTAVWVAKVFGLPIHKGQGWNGPILSPEEAEKLEPKLGEVPVTVEVYEGDTFNLGNMTLTRNGKVIHAIE
jgi:hypothetical protein